MPDPSGNAEVERLVLAALKDNATPSSDEIRTLVVAFLPIVKGRYPSEGFDIEAIVKHLETLCNVWVESSTSLVDEKGHIEWLSGKRGQLEWRFWDRYCRFLEDVKALPPNTVRNLDDVTGHILSLLEDPSRQGPWDRRGMVVGQVQSGKTSNYIGLICKAADAGYRLIVVLAGVHNSLRSQTQLRLDEGFLGFDTQKRMSFDRTNVRIGVGLLPGAPLLTAHGLTNSADDGDFKLAVAKNAGVMVGGNDPVVLVVKKYKSVLQNLIKYATAIHQQKDPTSGAVIVRDVPLLIIDDEADHASVNTAPESTDETGEIEPKAINRLIRQLLKGFDKSVYVGYTATPFANIFIRPPGDNPGQYGEDLFPRSFILSLRAPSNYLGPANVFGLPEDTRAGIAAMDGLPVIRPVRDYMPWMPDRHKKDLVPVGIPLSLKNALHSFFLVCAARIARGHDRAHNSMLVHVTRFTLVQERVVELVQQGVEETLRRLQYGDGASSNDIYGELRGLWDDDFGVTTQAMAGYGGTKVDWGVIRDFLVPAVSKIRVKQINGRAEDILDYYQHPEGISVIAIGGDKLSRGLTLEGLSVSYYLRAAKMYDTLMQMGRWFGYRPGYADLCRLYTTPELITWYERIALADTELRQEFDYMRLLGKTPMEYGLRVRGHPDGLMVTSRAKMRNSEVMRLSFAGTISETIVFFRDGAEVQRNRDAGEAMLAAAEKSGHRNHSTGTQVWTAVPAAEVLGFLGSYKTHESATKAQAKYLAEYIEAQQRHGELVEWTVALVSSQAPAARKRRWGGWEVGLIERGEFGTTKVDSVAAIKRLVSPRDEMLDMSREERGAALALTIRRYENKESRSKRTEPPTEPDGVAVRTCRPKSRGLLLLYPLLIVPEVNAASGNVPGDPGLETLGIAISFPSSETAQKIEYVVNNVFWDQEVSSP